jgi:predicted esterase
LRFVTFVAALFAALAVSLLGAPRSAFAKPQSSALGPPTELEVHGEAPAYFYAPRAKGGQRPVIVWLHGRSGNPEADCQKWAKVATEVGWILCPSGPENRGGGARGWNNSWPAAKRTVDATLAAFLAKFGKRVKPNATILIGFSEGALAAMNIGVREPDVFPKWLILAANDVYWGMDGLNELKKNKKQIKRVYLLTGEKDGVVDNTRRVYDSMEKEGVKTRIWTPSDIGHEVPSDRMRTFYRKPLRWLASRAK